MVNTKRIRKISSQESINGPVVYWMSRDQRVEDNWALLFAQELAEKNKTSIVVVFCLRKTFPFATERLVGFMVSGLKQIETALREKNIPFYFLLGDPVEEIEKFVIKYKCGAVVADFSPLKIYKKWKEDVSKKITIPFFEVDAHNIVPVWEASDHQEYGAYTLRPKLKKKLHEFLEEFPKIKKQTIDHISLSHTDWKSIRSSIQMDSTVAKLPYDAGERAASEKLAEFISQRLTNYAEDRNYPVKDAQSHLSFYLHFGHISAQRVAMEVEKVKGVGQSKNAFLEELIVRRELSDNYCYYNSFYDSYDGFPQWAKKTIQKHAKDKREYVYDFKTLKNAETHDALWNAAQMEMVKTGKMHGYMRMYWAKKIFEWSEDATIAQKHALELNDTYFLDGRDPNGYTGIAWSMGGVHDRPWFERPIFGTIRYMSSNGAKSKFDINSYISKCSKL